MATTSPADNVLKQLREQAEKQTQFAYDYYRADEETQKAIKEQMAKQVELDGIAASAAKEMADAGFSQLEETGKQMQYQEIADKMAARKREEMVAQFGEFGAVLKSSINNLGSAIKEDLGQLGDMFGALDALPGIKTIKALLAVIATTLTKLFLNYLKNANITPDWIKDRIGMGADGVDIGQTLKNFTPDFLLSDEEREKKKESMKGESSIREQMEGDKPQLEKPKKEGPKLKADGTKDMRFKENQGFMYKMQKGFNDKMQSMGDTFGRVGGGMKKAGGKLKGMGGKLMGVLGKVGRIFMMMATGLWSVIVTVATAVGSFIAGLAASAMSMLVAAAPLLLKALLIAAIVAGLIFIGWYVYKKFQENKDYIMAKWEQIKESFMIAMDGLVLWKDKAVTFISNIFNKMWLGIRSLFVAVVEGIESAINYIISGVNALIPGEKYDIEPVDIGAGRMRAELDADYAAFEAEQATQAQEFADREKGLADRKAANTMDRHLGNTVVQTNQTVNEGNKSTTVMPSGTTPVDTNAANMALAQ